MSTNDFAAFAALDLAPIKMKLMHLESGEGWSALRADAVEAEYRRFLFLMNKYPDAEASPSVDVDTFWHYHILDTQKYAQDCEVLFGYFLHHYPYVGIGGGANEDDHAAGGERMRAIYETEFGAWPVAHGGSAFCTAPGKPRQAANEDAFCTSPGKPALTAEHAFCTSPGKPRQAANQDAFCTSPGKPRESTDSAHAFCTSPGKPIDAAHAFCTAPGKPVANAAHAFCTSPGKPVEAAHAFCTAPGKPAANAAHSFCTSPGKPRAAAGIAYAFCTSPGMPLHVFGATHAFCTSPGKPSAANAAYAFCTSPGKPLQADAADRRAVTGQELAQAA